MNEQLLVQMAQMLSDMKLQREKDLKTISLLLLSSNELVPEDTRKDCLRQATEMLSMQQTKAQEMFHAGGDLASSQDLPNNVIR